MSRQYIKTKSRRWRDLLFAVGIGYADITKIDRGVLASKTFISDLPFYVAGKNDGLIYTFTGCPNSGAGPLTVPVKTTIAVQPPT